MSQLQSKAQINRLAWLFMVTYMISYITRINYGALVSEMEHVLQIPKTQVSMALTGSFITYGLGQILSGIIGDRVSPKKLIFYGLITGSGMNLLIPMCRNAYQMLAVWCVNGLAQAFLWPPMVRLMVSLVPGKEYPRVNVRVGFGSLLGTIAVYLVSPLILSLLGWKAVFFVSAGCGAAMALIWRRCACDAAPQAAPPAAPAGKTSKRVLLCPVILGVMLAIVLQGMLRDGITTWMPSYISETYHISNRISILTGVALPLFSMACIKITSKLYSRWFTNPLVCASVLFGASTAAALGLSLLSGRIAAVSVALSALLEGCIHGVNFMLICMLPPFFKKQGCVSRASGLLNFCTYIGSAASTYGIAFLSENIGWHGTLIVWLGIAAAGTGICLACVKPWSRKAAALEEEAA